MNQAAPCPYCGNTGYHVWAGSGGCPGAVSERERDQAAAAYIRLLLEELARASTQSIELREELKACRRLLTRAADALEFWMKDLASTEQQYVNAAMRHERLLSELRKAATE